MNKIKLDFDIIRLMEILRTYRVEQLRIKHCFIKHLMLLQMQNIANINEVLFQWFMNVLIKILRVLILPAVLLKVKLCWTSK